MNERLPHSARGIHEKETKCNITALFPNSISTYRIVESKELSLLYRVENTHRRTLIASAFVPRPVRFDILVVEDDEDQLSLFTEVLALAGYAVHGVSTAANALMTLRAAYVDLLITDIRLGSPMNGFELTDLAQSIQPSLQTLFITGFTKGVASRQRAVRPDVQILLKPFSLINLVGTVSQILNRSVSTHPALS